MSKLKVLDSNVTVVKTNNEDYISLTDIIKSRNSIDANDIIRNRGILEFIGTWEKIYNPDFKVVEFDHFKMEVYRSSYITNENIY